MTKHHCRDCRWLSDEKHSVGNRCTNTSRKMRESRYHPELHTNEFKYPSCPACKSGFEPKRKIEPPTCLTDPERRKELLERYKE